MEEFITLSNKHIFKIVNMAYCSTFFFLLEVFRQKEQTCLVDKSEYLSSLKCNGVIKNKFISLEHSIMPVSGWMGLYFILLLSHESFPWITRECNGKLTAEVGITRAPIYAQKFHVVITELLHALRRCDSISHTSEANKV